MHINVAEYFQYFQKLEKGQYRARVQIRHESEKLLERFRDLELIVRFKLDDWIDIDCFASLSEAYASYGEKFKTTGLHAGASALVYTTPIVEYKCDNS
jgi:hypothetical protein